LATFPGEHVLDLGCGTGNAALAVAEQGAQVIGVDPASRLLDVARARASAVGLAIDFRLGDAADIPLPDNSVDAVVSVFAVVFAPDAKAAAAEITRVLRPGGRVVLSAWTPIGAPAGPGALRREALAELGYEQPSDSSFPWHDAAALNGLFGPFGLTFEVHRHQIAITAASPQDYADADLDSHPLWVEARTVLEAAGRWKSLRDKVIELQFRVNEDPSAFRVTCPYVIAAGRFAG
jgi:SAM-dependent methyltransferase